HAGHPRALRLGQVFSHRRSNARYRSCQAVLRPDVRRARRAWAILYKPFCRVYSSLRRQSKMRKLLTKTSVIRGGIWRVCSINHRTRTERNNHEDQAKNHPCLWFNFNADKGMNRYLSIFTRSTISEVSRYGDARPELKGKVLIIRCEMEGQQFQ